MISLCSALALKEFIKNLLSIQYLITRATKRREVWRKGTQVSRIFTIFEDQTSAMKKAVFYILFCLVSVQAFGWGATGHRVTGMIAEQYLNSKAKAKLRELLGQETLWMV